MAEPDEPWRLTPVPNGSPAGEVHIALRADGAGAVGRFFIAYEHNDDVAFALGEGGNREFKAWKWGWDFSFDEVLSAEGTPPQLWAIYGKTANQAIFMLDRLNGLEPKSYQRGLGYADLPIPNLPGCPWDGSKMSIRNPGALESLQKFNRHLNFYLSVTRKH